METLHKTIERFRSLEGKALPEVRPDADPKFAADLVARRAAAPKKVSNPVTPKGMIYTSR